MSRLSVE